MEAWVEAFRVYYSHDDQVWSSILNSDKQEIVSVIILICMFKVTLYYALM